MLKNARQVGSFRISAFTSVMFCVAEPVLFG
jgi:hypothetical protein